jgi:hypothetical protein
MDFGLFRRVSVDSEARRENQRLQHQRRLGLRLGLLGWGLRYDAVAHQHLNQIAVCALAPYSGLLVPASHSKTTGCKLTRTTPVLATVTL